MDEATRRKYRTMLKQLRAYADQFGFRYALDSVDGRSRRQNSEPYT
jgi:hypothetical protein